MVKTLKAHFANAMSMFKLVFSSIKNPARAGSYSGAFSTTLL